MIVLVLLALIASVLSLGLALAVLAGTDPFIEDRRR